MTLTSSKLVSTHGRLRFNLTRPVLFLSGLLTTRAASPRNGWDDSDVETKMKQLEGIYGPSAGSSAGSGITWIINNSREVENHVFRAQNGEKTAKFVGHGAYGNAYSLHWKDRSANSGWKNAIMRTPKDHDMVNYQLFYRACEKHLMILNRYREVKKSGAFRSSSLPMPFPRIYAIGFLDPSSEQFGPEGGWGPQLVGEGNANIGILYNCLGYPLFWCYSPLELVATNFARKSDPVFQDPTGTSLHF